MYASRKLLGGGLRDPAGMRFVLERVRTHLMDEKIIVLLAAIMHGNVPTLSR